MQTSERWTSPYLPIYATLALAAGIWVGQEWLTLAWWQCAGPRLSPHILWLLAPLPLLVYGLWRLRHRHALIPLLCFSFALLGIWRYLSHPFFPCPTANALVRYHADSPYEHPLTLEGVVTGYPETRATYTQYRVRIDALWQESERVPVQGVALVRSQGEQSFRYGDRLRIRGTPTTPPSFVDFDYRRFLARKGIDTLVQRGDLTLLASDQGNPFWSALYTLRATASHVLDQLLPQPYAALANGMILGIESGIPRSLYDEFNLTGSSHVIVISGSNIAIVSGILLGLFSRLFGKRKNLATGVTITGIVLYTLLVGADAAVLRAALMGIFYVIAVHLERQSAAIISLFVAALLMLVLNPLTLWDVGFQLSFMATLGLILFNAPLKRRWDARLGRRLPRVIDGLLAEGLLVTLAAQITTMPMVVIYFGRLSLISFLVNFLILPVQPPIMIAGGLATLMGFFLLPVARVIALVPWGSLWWTVLIVEKMAAVPWGSLEVSAFGRLLAALYYGLFALGFLWWLLRQEQQADTFIPPTWRPALTRSLTAAALIALPLWGGATWWVNQPDGRLHLYLLGHDQSVEFLIVTPGGNHVLLTPERTETTTDLATLIAQIPAHNQTLALAILTRPATALPKLQRPPALLLGPDTPALLPGTTISLDTDVTLQLVLRPQDNTDSLLFQLCYHDFSTLLPFENTQEAQQSLLAQALPPPTLLVAPYPDVGAWPNPDLLAQLRPQITLLPTGITYPPRVQRALAARTRLLPIPADVVVEVVTDGTEMRLFSFPYAENTMLH